MSDLLIALRTFIRLAEVPSFSRVGKEMHASHTTIARRLDLVEVHFGVRLFHRTTRRLVAHPDYPARHGASLSADDLTRHQCIAYAYGDMPTRWTIDGRERLVDGLFRSDNSEAVHRAALNGLGIALLPAIRVEADMAAGRLAPVLPDSAIAPRDIFAVHPSRRRLPPRARIVLDFIQAHFPAMK